MSYPTPDHTRTLFIVQLITNYDMVVAAVSMADIRGVQTWIGSNYEPYCELYSGHLRINMQTYYVSKTS